MRDGFTKGFGRDLIWWGTLVGILAALILVELLGDVCMRWLWPTEIEIWQELEQDEKVRKRLVEVGGYGIGSAEAEG